MSDTQHNNDIDGNKVIEVTEAAITDSPSGNLNSSPANKKKKFSKDEITEQNCQFEDGEELVFTRVRFPGHARSYAFLVGNRQIMYGQKVVAMSDRGMAVGYINSFEYSLPFKKSMLPLKCINKIATEQDIEKELESYKRQKEVETLCHDLITKHKLQMNLTHVEFTQFGKKVVFYFIAPARVDFRGLVRDLVAELKLRIELRQISVRDRAASMGALGPCGRELCCSSFLTKYGNASIKMAKNQNLTLNYSKLNGVCGQLKCCLSFEEEAYSEKRKKLPNEGQLVKTKNGSAGKVRRLDILNERFDILTDKGQIKRFTFDQVAQHLKPADYVFPNRFDNISDDTSTIIGLKELEITNERQLKIDHEKLNKSAKKFAMERIIEMSEFLPPVEEGSRELALTELEKEKIPTHEELKQERVVVEPMNFNPSVGDESLDNPPVKKEAPARNNNRNRNNNNKNRNNNRNKNNNNRNAKPASTKPNEARATTQKPKVEKKD
jgi:cell fate regulator YaaT (PSP1 superfamily)